MSGSKENLADWLHTPVVCEVQSLWACLHDGELLSCKSDLIARSVILEVKVDHLLDDSQAHVKFLLRVEGVTSVRAVVEFPWPGGVSIPEGTTREDESRLINEYWAKWREESISWQVFESTLAVEALEIHEAELARGNNSVTLKLGGFLYGEPFDDHYCTAFIRGSNISASRSDGLTFSLEEFMRLGREFWETLSERPPISD